MQTSRRPRAVSAPKERRDHADEPNTVPGTASEMSDRLEIAVIEMQIDNIHLELDAQMYRTTQLETLLVGIKEELHELIDLVKSLQQEVMNRPATAERAERTVLH
jgi:hypothetical protein